MDNLYIVESPLQALCALEISLSKVGETHGIVVKTSGSQRDRNHKQILSIVGKVEWDFFLLVNSSENKYSIFNHIYLSSVLRVIKRNFKGKVESLYIGEFRSVFMHMVRNAVNANEECLLDDGSVTIEVVEKYLSKGCFYPFDKVIYQNNLIKLVFRIIYYGFFDIGNINRRIKLYTVYKNVDYDYVESLSFSLVKKLFSQKRSIDHSLVYFYGSKYSEAKITSIEYELSFLKKVSDFYRDRNKNVIYFAHRDESIKKLDIIKNKFGFNVSIPYQAAEVFLLESKVLPSEISSACSSVLINCSVVFPEINLCSFRIDSNQITDVYRVGIDITYDYIKEIGIPVIG